MEAIGNGRWHGLTEARVSSECPGDVPEAAYLGCTKTVSQAFSTIKDILCTIEEGKFQHSRQWSGPRLQGLSRTVQVQLRRTQHRVQSQAQQAYNGKGNDLPDLFLYRITGMVIVKIHSMPVPKDDRLSSGTSIPSQLWKEVKVPPGPTRCPSSETSRVTSCCTGLLLFAAPTWHVSCCLRTRDTVSSSMGSELLRGTG